MPEEVYKTIELENKHTLQILDRSRMIGKDAFLVKMAARLEISITPDLFSLPLPDGVSVEKIIAVLGEQTAWEYEVERNFIKDKDKDAVFNSLVKTFLENLEPYVSKPHFPEKFIIKEFQDKTD